MHLCSWTCINLYDFVSMLVNTGRNHQIFLVSFLFKARYLGFLQLDSDGSRAAAIRCSEVKFKKRFPVHLILKIKDQNVDFLYSFVSRWIERIFIIFSFIHALWHGMVCQPDK
jgi:hypothetical protein